MWPVPELYDPLASSSLHGRSGAATADCVILGRVSSIVPKESSSDESPTIMTIMMTVMMTVTFMGAIVYKGGCCRCSHTQHNVLSYRKEEQTMERRGRSYERGVACPDAGEWSTMAADQDSLYVMLD